MSYRNRKHYRVAQKSAEMSPNRGVFVSNTQKSKIAVAGLAILAVTFLNGILIGHTIFKR